MRDLSELPPLEATPFCTIVVPAFNEEEFLEGVVRAAMRQTYPRDKIEILIVDGASTDATRAIALRLADEDPRVRVVDNPERLQSAGMNEAIRRARGDVIVRLDAHAEYAADYVEKSVEALRRTGAANAGGAARAKHRTRFQRAMCAALSSKLGVGGSAYRDPTREGFVESVWGGAFRREAFEVAGLYDRSARTNEDAELNQRIIEAGGKVYLSRDIVAYYYPRSSLRALAKQYFAYGEGRARTLKNRGKLLSIRPLVPYFMVTSFALSIAATLVFPSIWPALATALLAYAAVILFEALRVGARWHVADVPLLLAIFPTMHVAHGLGAWRGLLKALHAETGSEPERLPA